MVQTQIMMLLISLTKIKKTLCLYLNLEAKKECFHPSIKGQ